jgi:4-amino-4-deoxy-L-arabinose transferase-like glycosyltransferase
MTQKDLSAKNVSEETSSYRSVLASLKTFMAGWYGPALCVVLLLSLFLDFFRLGQGGYGTLYYAAAVKSMLLNWHNFFFVSFDPGGFVTVDKPPLGFWLQVLSAKIFTFNTWSILLPQALAGVCSVALLAHLVRRAAGPLAGLVAGLTLAVMPINVVTNRSNNVDSLLVLAVLCAAWAIIVAAETGRLRLLLLGAAIIGLGFNIKMLEAYLVVPAFALLYLLCAPLRKRTKTLHLVLAGAVLLAVSLCWIAVVDLTPVTQRPYVGSSGNNSEMSLAFGYNGLTRIFGFSGLQSTFSLTSVQQAGSFMSNEIGDPGPLRLLNQQLGGQVSWLLPLALVGMLAIVWQRRPRLGSDRERQSILLWGVWFLTTAVFFSVSAFFHVYYMVMMAPALCALIGIGLAAMWRDFARLNWRGLLLPVVYIVTLLVQIHLLLPFPTESRVLLPIDGALVVLTVALLFAVRFLFRAQMRRAGRPLLVVGLTALLIAPTLWATLPVLGAYNEAFPSAGPLPPPTTLTRLLSQYERAFEHLDPAMVRYLIAQQGKADAIVATTTSGASSNLIIETGKPVMTLGGYEGLDHILTRDQAAALVHQGRLRFFLFPDYVAYSHLPFELHLYFQELSEERPVPASAGQQYITEWVQTNCLRETPDTWGSGIYAPDGTLTSNSVLGLYDCAGAR